MAVQLLISGNSTKGGASYAAPRTNAKGRGKIAGRLLAAVPQDTRPDAAPVDFFSTGNGADGGAGAEKDAQ